MAVHTYIGARYVPRFAGTYDATQIYEALDVVDNGSGTSYIAKQTVPAGTPLTDTDYWFVYGAASGAIINLQNQIDALNDAMTGVHQSFVTPEMFGAVADGVTDNTAAVQDAIDTGVPVYIRKDVMYNRNNLVYPRDAIIYDESDGGYIRLISNGYEGGAVNEVIVEAPYHPAVILDVNDQLNSDAPDPGQTETVAAVGFRHNNNGKWALRADFALDQFRVEHFDGYSQPLLIQPRAVIIDNRDYVNQIDTHGYQLFVNGMIALEKRTSAAIGIRLLDANDDLDKYYQMFFDTEGFKFVNIIGGTPYTYWKISANGIADFNTVSLIQHSTTEIKNFPNTMALGTIANDITLGKPVYLKSKNPMTWADFTGTTVYTGNN